MPLSKDLREFVGLLNANRVEYLVVGAFAVAHHGVPRYTAYLDLLLRPSPENAERMLGVLSEFGFRNLGVSAADFQEPDKVIQLGVSPNRIDLLTSISGVTFDDAWSTREEGDLDGVTVNFIGRAALIRNKEHTGRSRDVGDAEELRKSSVFSVTVVEVGAPRVSTCGSHAEAVHPEGIKTRNVLLTATNSSQSYRS
jgi:acetolactate synthase regulatory subunit